jgi:hypothetical protein
MTSNTNTNLKQCTHNLQNLKPQFKEIVFATLVNRTDIFRPQTRQFGEITVLYTQLADEKLGVNCARSLEIIALFLSTEYLDYRVVPSKTCSPTLRTHTMFPRFLSDKLCVQHGDFPKLACLRSKDVASVANMIFLHCGFRFCKFCVYAVLNFIPGCSAVLVECIKVCIGY